MHVAASESVAPIFVFQHVQELMYVLQLLAGWSLQIINLLRKT
jgi:hypothetical protein